MTADRRGDGTSPADPFDDQRDAASRELRTIATAVALDSPRPLTADSLSEGAQRALLELVYRLGDGAMPTCYHLHPDAPQPTFTASWAPVAACAQCRPLLIPRPRRYDCDGCDATVGRVVGVTAGPILVFLTLCLECAR